MLNDFEIKNVSQTKTINLLLSSIQDQDHVKTSISPTDSFSTKIVKEGVRKLEVSIAGDSNFWEGIIPVNISGAILINPDNRTVSYKDHMLVSNMNNMEDSNTYIILILIALSVVACVWLYKRK